MAHYNDAKVSDEMKIVRWIQFMRCAEVALQKLMTKEEWDTTVQKALYRYVQVEPNGRGDVEVKETK